jgi:ABC-type multidrug transport system ATPase subunit
VGCIADIHPTKNTTLILILEVDSVELSFDSQKILYGVYLKAEKGKATGILGRNGCGKTSLLRIIFGDLNPKYKNIRIDGIHQKKALFKQGNIAYLPQHQLLPKSIKLSTVFKFFNVNWNGFVKIFESFEPYRAFKTNQLSSGELRVVETYLILSSKRNIILLDEPFSFIAPLYIERIKNLMLEKKEESALLITDHFYRDILEASDSVYLLKNGTSKLVQSKTDLENEGYINFAPF